MSVDLEIGCDGFYMKRINMIGIKLKIITEIMIIVEFLLRFT